MKCGFCGSELENGAQFCPNCGMIISLGDENDNSNENSDAVVESVYNVFKSNIEKQPQPEPKAVELQADPKEEKVEFVMSLPEFDEYSAEPMKVPEHIEVPDHSKDIEEKEEIPQETETATEEAESEADVPEKVQDTAEIADEPEEVTEETAEDAMEDIYSYSSEDMREQDEAAIDINVPEVDVIYEGPEKAPEPIAVPVVAPKNEKLREQKQAKENLQKISPDKKETKKTKKSAGKKNGIDGIKIEGVLGVAIALILVLFACVYAVKNDKIPVLGELFGNDNKPEFIGDNGEEVFKDKEGNYYYCDDDGVTYIYVVDNTQESTEPTEDPTEDTTEEPTEDTTEEPTEDTTEEPTEEPTESTTEPTTEPSTTDPITTEPTTTDAPTTKPITTKPTTTKPTTTKPAPTTKPVTRPVTNPTTTTKPVVTTKPTTTDKFGINDVTVKKPSSYLAKSYTGYVTAEGVNLRSKPTTESDRVLYLSKGADVVVLAKENGFFYIKSNRYGVYGWVSATYIATSRPQSESVVQSGTVAPDKKYDTAQIKYTTNGLNVRKGPSTSYDIVGLVPISYPVKVIGYKSGVSGWVYVQDTTYGYTGWVSTAYIK